MRLNPIVAALALAVPALLSAQATSPTYSKKTTASQTKKTVTHRTTHKATATAKGEVTPSEPVMASPATPPETVYVKGTVTGEPPRLGDMVRGVRGVIISHTVYDSTMTVTPMTTPAPEKPTVDKKVSHGAGEAASDASKLGKKVVHGVKEAASDVKKKVTKKP